MDLIQLDIAALKTSDSQNNAYVLLLNELTGKRQLPIVIGWCEARSIALALEDADPPERPLTHDLFLSLSDSFDITVTKVVIHTLNEGIFHASFFCKSEKGKEMEGERDREGKRGGRGNDAPPPGGGPKNPMILMILKF